MHARDIYPTILHNVLVAALKRKTMQLVLKAMAAHRALMTFRAWSAHFQAVQTAGLNGQHGAGVVQVQPCCGTPV
jgi:hypothetical protein